MSNDRHAAAGAWLAVGTMMALTINHVHFWFFEELADGGHVAADFIEAGVNLQTPERVAGFLIAGVPITFYVLCLYMLMRVFRCNVRQPRDHDRLSGYLKASGHHALLGSVTLMLYPTILSIVFMAMQSMERPTVILSVEPHVFLLLVIAGLLFLLARSLEPVLAEHSRRSPPPVTGERPADARHSTASTSTTR